MTFSTRTKQQHTFRLKLLLLRLSFPHLHDQHLICHMLILLEAFGPALMMLSAR